MPVSLPIDEVLPQLTAALARHSSVVLRAPTGAGKTTRVPPALLDAGLAGAGRILLLEPRRIAAQAAARRIAEERGATLGGEVGYQVRFDKKLSGSTRILAMTDGIFLRMLQDDPFLERVGAVLFDEFHERSVNVDLALAMVRKVQREIRPDLKLVVMSATLSPEAIAKYLGDAPIVESRGRQFPVEIRYQKHHSSAPAHESVADGVRELFAETTGDVLAFLPGVGEIRRAADELRGLAEREDAFLYSLYGDLPFAEQQQVLEPSPRRKIVLATNVAETSVTIPGVTAVVDSGLARTLRMDPALGLNRLEVVRIARAAADQRAGRAGRTGPGVCLRLWTEREQSAMRDHETPEILRVDLAGPVLELLCWGEPDVRGFPWFDPPPAASLDQALLLLERLGAVGPRGITEQGKQLARLPMHPRIARLLLEGAILGEPARAALAGALLAERDPFLRSPGPRGGARQAGGWSDSDVLDRVAALEQFDNRGGRHTEAGSLDSGAARFVLRARDEWLRLLENELRDVKRSPDRNLDSDEVLLRAIYAGFPDRLARRREAAGRRGVMIGGRGIKLHERSAVVDPELFVCVDLEETGHSEALVRQASVVRREWLDESRLKITIDVEFDPARQRVIARRRTRIEDLVLDEAITNVPKDYDASGILAQAATERLDLTTMVDEPARNYLARLESLRGWRPELELPDLGEDPLRSMLPQLAAGCLSFDDLKKAPVVGVLKNLLTSQQLAAVEREAPERVQVPSGSWITLRYEAGQPPVLAVRIQEVFGMAQTPRVGGGRVPVVMHLLAPNMRPQQVTQDLASFWKNTYAEVRKELKRRYPKHSWPEDPTQATPENRPRRK